MTHSHIYTDATPTAVFGNSTLVVVVITIIFTTFARRQRGAGKYAAVAFQQAPPKWCRVFSVVSPSHGPACGLLADMQLGIAYIHICNLAFILYTSYMVAGFVCMRVCLGDHAY